jgi:class 3 adenylate cyclase/CHASE2 domain-containing sensor protein
MRSFQRTAFAVGALVTAVVLLADLLGAFRWPEDWTLDLRLRHARWVEENPGPQLRLVAIDDNSLDTIGRWPWPREKIAMAVDEVARAGARVLAFDVLFLEREDGTRGDEALARAMSAIPSVVAVSVRQDASLDAMWFTPAGVEALRRLSDAARGGVDRDMAEIVAEASLEEPFRSRVLERPVAFKALAAWSVLERLDQEDRLPADLDGFVRLMLGGTQDAERTGDFGERVLLERAWERGESWRRLEPSLVPVDTSGSPQDLPPIPPLAAAAKAAGVVNAEPDAFDGRLRRVRPMFPSNYGLVPQLGLMAALAWEGAALDRVRIEGDRMEIGARQFQLRGGRLPISWPTRLLAGYGDHAGPQAVVSIGRLIEQAEARRLLERQRQRLDELGLDIAAGVLGKERTWFERAAADGSLAREIEDVWNFDYADGADDVDLTPEQRRAVEGLREWRMLAAAVSDGQRRIDEGDARLRAILGDGLVFMGFTATGTMADMVSTIFDPRTPGVFSHIAVADMVLNDRDLKFAAGWSSPVAVLLLGLTAAVVAARFGAAAGFAALAVLLAVYVGVLGMFLFDRLDLVYPMAAPVFAGASSWIVATAAVAIVNQREKQRIQRQFRARVSPQLVDMLQQNPDALSMSGVERETTILFGDLAGFTTISEKLGGPDVVKTLNLYMGAMTRELTDQHAYVNKFLGDGLLAFWSAFAPEPRQGEYAVQAAMNCQRIVRQIGQRPDRAGLPPITLRLGIATGKVVIGDCGAPPDLNDYTVIGDSVNLASRLESANKQFGTAVLVDGRTAESARAAGLPLLGLGKVVVVGQSVPVDLFEVCLDDDPGERIRLTEEAVSHFAAGRPDPSRAAFAELERRCGPSRTASCFRSAMDDPQDRRDGVLRLRAK